MLDHDKILLAIEEIFEKPNAFQIQEDTYNILKKTPISVIDSFLIDIIYIVYSYIIWRFDDYCSTIINHIENRNIKTNTDVLETIKYYKNKLENIKDYNKPTTEFKNSDYIIDETYSENYFKDKNNDIWFLGGQLQNAEKLTRQLVINNQDDDQLKSNIKLAKDISSFLKKDQSSLPRKICISKEAYELINYCDFYHFIFDEIEQKNDVGFNALNHTLYKKGY